MILSLIDLYSVYATSNRGDDLLIDVVSFLKRARGTVRGSSSSTDQIEDQVSFDVD